MQNSSFKIEIATFLPRSTPTWSPKMSIGSFDDDSPTVAAGPQAGH